MSLFGLKNVSAQEWLKVAYSAKVFSAADADAASKQVAKLPAPLRTRAEAILDEVAHTPPSSAAVDALCKKLNSAIAGFRDPNSDYGGEEPNVATVKQATRAVLHGLLVRAGSAARNHSNAAGEATGLVRAVESLDVYDKAVKSSLLTELNLALGDDLAKAARQPPKPSQPAP